MLAACFGSCRMVRMLLSKGASMSIVDLEGLSLCILRPVTKLLVKARADLESNDFG